jgi:hypothetical protein
MTQKLNFKERVACYHMEMNSRMAWEYVILKEFGPEISDKIYGIQEAHHSRRDKKHKNWWYTNGYSKDQKNKLLNKAEETISNFENKVKFEIEEKILLEV